MDAFGAALATKTITACYKRAVPAYGLAIPTYTPDAVLAIPAFLAHTAAIIASVHVHTDQRATPAGPARQTESAVAAFGAYSADFAGAERIRTCKTLVAIRADKVRNRAVLANAAVIAVRHARILAFAAVGAMFVTFPAHIAYSAKHAPFIASVAYAPTSIFPIRIRPLFRHQRYGAERRNDRGQYDQYT